MSSDLATAPLPFKPTRAGEPGPWTGFVYVALESSRTPQTALFTVTLTDPQDGTGESRGQQSLLFHGVPVWITVQEQVKPDGIYFRFQTRRVDVDVLESSGPLGPDGFTIQKSVFIVDRTKTLKDQVISKTNPGEDDFTVYVLAHLDRNRKITTRVPFEDIPFLEGLTDKLTSS
ncbi:hypothetical protein MMC24_003794 [Lignoscripta atroalba]|nr:hypothetical protein [Lignoscripta atroalba]